MNIIKRFFIAALVINVVSCREYDDDILSVNLEKDITLENQFKSFWTIMDHRYPIWDYEAEHGLNWDDIYYKFLPKFQELDRRYINDGVAISDSLLTDMYRQIISPLHDGHFQISEILNPHTGNVLLFGVISPQSIRVKKRDDYSDNPQSIIKHYLESEEDFAKIIDSDSDSERWPNIEYCCFADNIVYFRLKQFNLSEYMNEDGTPKKLDDVNDVKYQEVWKKWFDKVQELHYAHKLKGLIVDLRNNGGGNSGDFQFVLGTLIKADEDVILDDKEYEENLKKVGKLRFKHDIGRFDYSKPTPFRVPVFKEPHAVITNEPIVILTNAQSASCAEMTSYAAKQMGNAILVGMPTYGAISPLEDNYSVKNINNYISLVIPVAAFLTDDGTIHESTGIEPDIRIRFDKELFDETGRDSQLERALEYIRTGK